MPAAAAAFMVVVVEDLVVADSTGRYTRTYDADNLTTSMTNPEGNRLTFLYDAVRRREVLVDVSGGRSTSTYNVGGQLLVLSNPQGGLTTYSYDDADRRTGIRLLIGVRRSCGIIRRLICCMQRCGRCLAITSSKRDRWSRRIGCGSISRITRP